MSLLGRLFSVGPVRKAIWGLWYPFLTRRLQGENVLFLNYAFETDPPMGLALSAADEPHRGCIQLYHHVATQVELRGRRVLEVSCGHGGGAAYLTRRLQPAGYVGLDLNPAGIRFCRSQPALPGLEFLQGDACRLPFADRSFDAVLNVEASHCYPDFPAFLAEVARVLRPGGHFLYADFRFRGELAAWELALQATPLRPRQSRIINAEVLRGMERNSARSQALIERHMPGFLHALSRDFAGTRGSRIHAALQDGSLSYRSYCFARE